MLKYISCIKPFKSLIFNHAPPKFPCLCFDFTQGCIVNGVKYPDGHTMCLPDATNMTPLPPSDAEKQEAVDAHNKFRSGVSPKASNMMKMASTFRFENNGSQMIASPD